MPKVTSPLRLILLLLNQLSHHLLLVCPSVAKSICTFPRPRTCATQWIVLAFLDTLRRSTSEPSQYFEKLSLPCFTVTSHHMSYELHNFADARTSGYGQCSYRRVKDEDGNVNVSLVMGKSRVAPLKTTTIPRLELTAAVVSAKVGGMLQEEFNYANLKQYF